MIREHIQKFPASESHYSHSINVSRKRLDSSINVAKMNRIFIAECLDLWCENICFITKHLILNLT